MEHVWDQKVGRGPVLVDHYKQLDSILDQKSKPTTVLLFYRVNFNRCFGNLNQAKLRIVAKPMGTSINEPEPSQVNASLQDRIK